MQGLVNFQSLFFTVIRFFIRRFRQLCHGIKV